MSMVHEEMIHTFLSNMDYQGSPEEYTVVVAMSGGVDSSVTAGLLAEAGFKVIGITLQLYDHGQAIQKKGACCAGQDIYDARQVADHFNFPHYVLDYEEIFKQKVINQFANSYLQGQTPIPCIQCNQKVKFQDLLETARSLGANALITGHYVQRLKGKNGQIELHQSADLSKDQSYFLYGTTEEQLKFLRFPLGGIAKTDTRAQAARLGLTIAKKPDSQDICFVPTGKYASVIQKLKPGSIEPGDIIDQQGTVLGQHQGIIHYTIGQRKGLGIINSNRPLYVIGLDAEKHHVIVGPQEALACSKLLLSEVNWLDSQRPNKRSIKIKVRSSQYPLPATVTLMTNSSHQTEIQEALILLEQPEYGVAIGQACVFYDDTRVLGGGWICQTFGKTENIL